MRLLTLLTTITFLFSATSSFSVDGMMCGKGCVNKIKTHIGSLEGVKKCDVNFEKAVMTVEYDEAQLNDKLIIKRLHENTTYSCRPAKKEEPKKGLLRRILSWF